MDVLSVIMIFIVTQDGCTLHVMHSVMYSVHVEYNVQHSEDKMNVHHNVHMEHKGTSNTNTVCNKRMYIPSTVA